MSFLEVLRNYFSSASATPGMLGNRKRRRKELKRGREGDEVCRQREGQ